MTALSPVFKNIDMALIAFRDLVESLRMGTAFGPKAGARTALC
jgi:hypothetical protein